MSIIADEYERRCKDAKVRPRRRKFKKADKLARTYITAATSHPGRDGVDEDLCSPYVLVNIDDTFYYFVKVVGTTAYPCILTGDEAKSLGYLE